MLILFGHIFESINKVHNNFFRFLKIWWLSFFFSYFITFKEQWFKLNGIIMYSLYNNVVVIQFSIVGSLDPHYACSVFYMCAVICIKCQSWNSLIWNYISFLHYCHCFKLFSSFNENIRIPWALKSNWIENLWKFF